MNWYQDQVLRHQHNGKRATYAIGCKCLLPACVYYINLSIYFLEKTFSRLPDLKAGKFSLVKPMPLLQQHFHPDLAVSWSTAHYRPEHKQCAWVPIKMWNDSKWQSLWVMTFYWTGFSLSILYDCCLSKSFGKNMSNLMIVRVCKWCHKQTYIKEHASKTIYFPNYLR